MPRDLRSALPLAPKLGVGLGWDDESRALPAGARGDLPLPRTAMLDAARLAPGRRAGVALRPGAGQRVAPPGGG